MKTLNTKTIAFWTLLSAAGLAAAAYAATAETPGPQEITEEESREVADLIQPRSEPQPAPQEVQGKPVQAPYRQPSGTRLATPKTGAPVTNPTTAQNT